jgi:hydrogenase-4 component B
MMLAIILACAIVLLALAPCAVMMARSLARTRLIYGVCAAIMAISLAAALAHLLGSRPPQAFALPVGVPWLGAHLRLDALSAFFLVVLDLGGMTASVFALGYGKHESAPGRVLPFYPAFLAAMTLVAVADDAFTFLMSWEFMSLTSWALVMSRHRAHENVRAGYVYLLMASFGTLTLLLAFGLLAGPDGLYTFGQMRTSHLESGLGALA